MKYLKCLVICFVFTFGILTLSACKESQIVEIEMIDMKTNFVIDEEFSLGNDAFVYIEFDDASKNKRVDFKDAIYQNNIAVVDNISVDFSNFDNTQIGTYTITVFVNNLKENQTLVEMTYSVSVEKRENSWINGPSINNWEYLAEPSIPVAVPSIGNASNVVFEYKESTQSDKYYSTLQPTMVGQYNLRATINAENTNPLSSTCNFEITKKVIPIPTIKSIEYDHKQHSANIETSEFYSVYSNQGGITVGTYYIELKLYDTKNTTWQSADYEIISEGLIKIPYSIIATTNKWQDSPGIIGWKYGNAPNSPILGTPKFNKNGEITYSFAKLIDNVSLDKLVYGAMDDLVDDDNFVPAGNYSMKIVVAGSENVKEFTSFVTFNVRETQNIWTENLTTETFAYGDPNIKATAKSKFGKVVIQYSLDGMHWTTDIPSDVGEYYVYAFVNATESYDRIESELKRLIITKNEIELPTIENLTYKIDINGNGQKQIANIENTEYFCVLKNDGGTDAGTYTVQIQSTNNYKWKDTTESIVEIEYKILPIQIEIPTGDIEKTYNKQPQSCGFEENFFYTIKNGTQTDAGTYTVTFVLKNKTNFVWKDESTTDKTITFRIKQATNSWISKKLVQNEFTYTGSPQEYIQAEASFGDVIIEYKLQSELDSSFTETAPTDIGEYTVRIYVIGNDNYTRLDYISYEFNIIADE